MSAPTHRVARSECVDIGGGRGVLMPGPAASLRRLDAALGRLWDINEAWRDPAVADRLHADFISGRSRIIALDGDHSIHCRGYAIDTDFKVGHHLDLLREHGWVQTVFRNGRLVEDWHFEYDEGRDRHIHETAPEARRAPQEDDMAYPFEIRGRGHRFLLAPGFVKHFADVAASDLTKNIVAANDEWIVVDIPTFVTQLDSFGIPRDMVDADQGTVRNPKTGTMERGGMWSWAREASMKLDAVIEKLR